MNDISRSTDTITAAQSGDPRAAAELLPLL